MLVAEPAVASDVAYANAGAGNSTVLEQQRMSYNSKQLAAGLQPATMEQWQVVAAEGTIPQWFLAEWAVEQETAHVQPTASVVDAGTTVPTMAPSVTDVTLANVLGSILAGVPHPTDVIAEPAATVPTISVHSVCSGHCSSGTSTC